MNPENHDQKISLQIPFKTIATILVTILCVKLLAIIAPLLLPLFIAILIAVSLMPFKRWLKKRVSSGVAVGIITALMLASVALIVSLIVPILYDQVASFISNAPKYKEQLLGYVGPQNPARAFIEKTLQHPAQAQLPIDIKGAMGAGNAILSGLAEVLIIFVLTIYLVSDGPRIYEWCRAFFARETQAKIDQTSHESSKIISAYVMGQLITSVLSFLFVAVSLTFVGVPNVMLLAVLAGVLDVLPVLGLVIAVIPAMLFALEISPGTSLGVLALYLAYHAIENYLIVPLVYGNRLQVSSFVVFFTLLCAGLVAGIEGAIAVLPLIASYPVIERIWLSGYVRREALVVHNETQGEG